MAGMGWVGGEQAPAGQPSIPVTSARPPWWGAGPTAPGRAWARCSPPPARVLHLVTDGGTACYGLETHEQKHGSGIIRVLTAFGSPCAPQDKLHSSMATHKTQIRLLPPSLKAA